PLIAGRDFDERDARFEPADPKAQLPSYKVAIVNESYAKHYFGDRSPLGYHIGFGTNPGTPTPIEIVGVVRDSKYTGVRDEIPRQLFFPMLEERQPGSVVVYLRTTGDPTAGFAAAQRTMHELDAKVPVYNLRTLERQIDRSLL